MIERTCRVSGEKFIIAKEDLEFYAKMGVITEDNLQDLISGKINDCSGLPTLCPDERQRRRMCWRNERTFYTRNCSGTGVSMISIYDKETSFPVYEQSYWWSDNWDAFDYGEDFDSSKSFFEQFGALMEVVPRKNLFQDTGSENSTYTNGAGYNKDCYLLVNGAHNEGTLYARGTTGCVDSMELYFSDKCELGYELIDCTNVFNVRYSESCRNCADSWFLKNCIGCNNCFGCVNLRNKQYYFLNKKLSKENYEKELKKLNLSKYSSVAGLRDKFQKFVEQYPQRCLEIFFSENCVGDFIQKSKNCYDCFEATECEDVKYADSVKFLKSSQDVLAFGYRAELLYETVSMGRSNNVFAGLNGAHNFDAKFLFECVNCNNCFGCVGLKHKQYCILNKQYTKESYEELLPKIIAHMKQTGEWGEFFPANMSPFAYNETVAQEYYPLTKEEAEKKGYKWKDEPVNKKYETLKQSFDWSQIPDDIQEVKDDILMKVLFCERSGKPYQIQKAELRFYRKMNLPIPHLHPDERHKDRMKLRNPRKLYERTCADCQKAIQTTFAPERPEKILCEDCYLKVVD
ncbi:hypothetical protein CSB37_03315 [bacterium DOLZORAL124_38_8]|nr:MAG: hypothetical protein CSB37_03315 [bacterium DOLZORAL124_38_8]